MSLNATIKDTKLLINISYKDLNEVILRILDKDGKVILIERPQNSKTEINVEWLEKGTYTLKLCTSSCELQKKFVKN